MSSEIEVVDEMESRDPAATAGIGNGGGGGGESAANASGRESDESLRNDVYTAAAYGDLEKLQRLVECEGCSVSETDGLGYHALQWAALNNRTAAAQYLIEVLKCVAFFFIFLFLFILNLLFLFCGFFIMVLICLVWLPRKLK